MGAPGWGGRAHRRRTSEVALRVWRAVLSKNDAAACRLDCLYGVGLELATERREDEEEGEPSHRGGSVWATRASGWASIDDRSDSDIESTCSSTQPLIAAGVDGQHVHLPT